MPRQEDPPAESQRVIVSTASTIIDHFHGSTETSQLSAEQWATMIDRLMVANNWSTEVTAAKAANALKGIALNWYEYVSDEPQGAAILAKWATFKPAFLNRFKTSRSAEQELSLIRNLIQDKSESVEVFYERVALTLKKVVSRNLQRELVSDGRAVLEVFKKIHFVNGVKEEIRAPLCRRLDQLTSTDAIVRAAISIEASMITTEPASINAINRQPPRNAYRNQPSQYSSNNNFNTNGYANNFRGNRRQRGRGNRRSSYNPQRQPPFRPPQSQSQSDKRRWIFCYRCKQWGLHYANECNRSLTQIAALTPQTDDSPLPGTPVDDILSNPTHDFDRDELPPNLPDRE